MLPTVYEPFETMRTLEREFNEIVNRIFGSRLEPDVSSAGWAWRPTTEMFRDGDNLIVRAELPGIDPEKDLDITVEGRVLHLAGRRSFDREVSDDRRYLVERCYGEFRRDVMLPEGMDADRLTAEYVDGVLTITVPLPEAVRTAEPKKIPVTGSKVKKLLGGKKTAG